MSILKRMKIIQDLLLDHGNYQAVADATGLTYHWVQKFACGSIKNPTVSNIAALENYFFKDDAYTQPVRPTEVLTQTNPTKPPLRHPGRRRSDDRRGVNTNT